jgi:hypothetical protein
MALVLAAATFLTVVIPRLYPFDVGGARAGKAGVS